MGNVGALRSEVDIRCRSTQIITCRGRLHPGVCPFPLPFVERQGDASRTSPTATQFPRHNWRYITALERHAQTHYEPHWSTSPDL